jgi:hypothetical protein
MFNAVPYSVAFPSLGASTLFRLLLLEHPQSKLSHLCGGTTFYVIAYENVSYGVALCSPVGIYDV